MEKEKNYKRYNLVLNLDDPEQKEMSDFLKKFPNVSGKLKRLVWLEMNRVERTYEPEQKQEVIEEEITDEQLDDAF